MKAFLASIFESVTTLRNGFYDRGIFKSYRSSLPVISVGNLTVGGNGKTPFVIYLVKQLTELGFHPVVLSRGYGGAVKGPHVVDDSDKPQRIGDEPFLMSQKLDAPVVIARKRAEGARFIEQNLKQVDLIVLDDGFQHRALERNIDILMIDIGSPKSCQNFLSAKLMPAGRFREERSAGLKRADLVVLAQRSTQKELSEEARQVKALLPDSLPVYVSYLSPGELKDRSGNILNSGTQQVFAFCGIASPQAFFSTLKQMGLKLEGEKSYPDHHSFTQSDITELKRRAAALPLVCTEKDYVKLSGDCSNGIFALEVGTCVIPEQQLFSQIKQGIK